MNQEVDSMRRALLGLAMLLGGCANQLAECPACQLDQRVRSTNASTKPATDQSFETDVLKANGPVLVAFWAEWCGPCRMIAPTMDELAVEFAGKVSFVKLNVDENPIAPKNYAVRSIPTLMLFKKGKPTARQVGAMTKPQMKDWLDGNM